MTPVTVHDGRTPSHSDMSLGLPQRGHGVLVVQCSDIAHEPHDQPRVLGRAGGNDGQSVPERGDESLPVTVC